MVPGVGFRRRCRVHAALQHVSGAAWLRDSCGEPPRFGTLGAFVGTLSATFEPSVYVTLIQDVGASEAGEFVGAEGALLDGVLDRANRDAVEVCNLPS